jgi:branched-chain amino acid transport system substrate-binding protein
VLAELCLTNEPDLGEVPVATDVVRVWSEGRVDTLRVGPDRRVSAELADLASRHAGCGVPGAPARVRRWLAPEGTWHRVVIHGAPRATVVGIRPEPIPHDLSHRELEVLGLISTGLSNFSISRRLDRSERTIAHCVERILEKLGVESRAGAAAIAESDGLIIIE